MGNYSQFYKSYLTTKAAEHKAERKETRKLKDEIMGQCSQKAFLSLL